MKHSTVAAWSQQLPCECATAWWALHGPSYVLVTEQDTTPCPHDGSVIVNHARVERN